MSAPRSWRALGGSGKERIVRVTHGLFAYDGFAASIEELDEG